MSHPSKAYSDACAAKRERGLDLWAAGWTSKTISDALGVAYDTPVHWATQARKVGDPRAALRRVT